MHKPLDNIQILHKIININGYYPLIKEDKTSRYLRRKPLNIENRMIRAKDGTLGGSGSTPPEMRFMKKMKELRLAKGMTQEELAKKVGVSQSQIARYENGMFEPDLETLRKLAAALDCTLDELIGRGEEKMRNEE